MSLHAVRLYKRIIMRHVFDEKLDPAGSQKKGKPLQGQSGIMKANAGKKLISRRRQIHGVARRTR